MKNFTKPRAEKVALVFKIVPIAKIKYLLNNCIKESGIYASKILAFKGQKVSEAAP